MKLSKIRFSYRSFASTNPPREISELTEFYEESGGEYCIKIYRSTNGYEVTRIYAVSAEQADRLAETFESSGIAELFCGGDTVNPPSYPTAGMAGGFENYGFSFTADGVSRECGFLPPQAQPVRAEIDAIIPECGHPVFENTSGEAGKAGAFACAPPAAEFPEKPPLPGRTPGEGEWICGECGSINTGAKFCIECGNPKLTKGE